MRAPAGLIVWRIWTVNKESSKFNGTNGHGPHQSRLSNVIRIVIESGLLYTVAVLVTFGTEVAGSTSLYPVAKIVCASLTVSALS